MMRFWWFATLLLTALGLTMGGAHLLELPVRKEYGHVAAFVAWFAGFASLLLGVLREVELDR